MKKQTKITYSFKDVSDLITKDLVSMGYTVLQTSVLTPKLPKDIFGMFFNPSPTTVNVDPEADCFVVDVEKEEIENNILA